MSTRNSVKGGSLTCLLPQVRTGTLERSDHFPQELTVKSGTSAMNNWREKQWVSSCLGTGRIPERVGGSRGQAW